MNKEILPLLGTEHQLFSQFSQSCYWTTSLRTDCLFGASFSFRCALPCLFVPSFLSNQHAVRIYLFHQPFRFKIVFKFLLPLLHWLDPLAFYASILSWILLCLWIFPVCKLKIGLSIGEYFYVYTVSFIFLVEIINIFLIPYLNLFEVFFVRSVHYPSFTVVIQHRNWHHFMTL